MARLEAIRDMSKLLTGVTQMKCFEQRAIIGIDLCELRNRVLLVICDYYSNFIEVERIANTTTGGVTKVLKPNLRTRLGGLG